MEQNRHFLLQLLTAQAEWMNFKKCITIEPIRAVSNGERSWIVLLSKIWMSLNICARFVISKILTLHQFEGNVSGLTIALNT